MPLYEYKCLHCGRRTEKIENVSGPHLRKCPHCGGRVEALITAPAIQFKGSGWYVTDYARKAASGDGERSEKPAEEKKEAGAKEGSTKEGSAKETSVKETPSKETGTKEKKTAKRK